jgi:hypothetical protein
MSLPANIDTLKSSITRRGGIAKANRFALYIHHPHTRMFDYQSGSLINSDIAEVLTNVISSGAAFNMGSFFNDPRDMFLFCDSATIPGRRITTMEQVHNHYEEKVPYSAISEEVTMSFLLTNDYYTKKYFDAWQDAVMDTSGPHYKPNFKNDYCSDIIIQQLTESSNVVPGYTVKLHRAWPLQVSSVELNNASGATALQVSITFEYDFWESVGLIDGFNDLIHLAKDAFEDTKNELRNWSRN